MHIPQDNGFLYHFFSQRNISPIRKKTTTLWKTLKWGSFIRLLGLQAILCDPKEPNNLAFTPFICCHIPYIDCWNISISLHIFPLVFCSVALSIDFCGTSLMHAVFTVAFLLIILLRKSQQTNRKPCKHQFILSFSTAILFVFFIRTPPPPAPSQCSISSTAIITFAVGFARYQTLSLTKSCSEKVSYENSSFPWKLDMHSVTSVFMRISRQSYKQISTSGSKNFWYQIFLLHDEDSENNTVLTWYHFNRRYECFAFMVVCYCLDW